LSIVVLALHWGRAIIIPVVLAGLIAFLLLPSVAAVQRRGVGRAGAVLIVGVTAAFVVLAIGWIVSVRILAIAETLPDSEASIRAKIGGLSGPVGGSVQKVLHMVERFYGFSPEAAPLAPEAPPQQPPVPHTTAEPLPVRVVEPGAPALSVLSRLAGPVLRPLAMFGLIGIVALFLLLRWDDVRDRVIRLVTRGRITLTTQALDELSRAISRVLRLQVAVNAGFGAATGLGLWAMGVPDAVLWGVFAALLRFIPYLGPLVAAAMPALVAVAAGESWAVSLEVLGLFLVIELLTGNVAEPWVFGASARVSSVALLLSAAFWTWLWGLPGLFLSTPITVGLAVIGRHVPNLAFLEVLFGDAPVLAPAARLYQRLVALDADDAAELARTFHKEQGLHVLYQDLILPALRQLEIDRQSGALEEHRIEVVFEGLAEIVEEAALREGETAPPVEVAAVPGGTAGPAAPATPAIPAVLCIPARDEADAISATMLAALLNRAGYAARALSLHDLGGDLGEVIRAAAPAAICIAAVPPLAAPHARRRRRQIELRAPGFPIIPGLWLGRRAEAMPAEPVAEPSVAHRSEAVATDFAQMIERVAAIARPARAANDYPAIPIHPGESHPGGAAGSSAG
jgi:predicted PurR-regulated permease PerM